MELWEGLALAIDQRAGEAKWAGSDMVQSPPGEGGFGLVAGTFLPEQEQRRQLFL